MLKIKTFVLKSDMHILFMQKGCQHKLESIYNTVVCMEVLATGVAIKCVFKTLRYLIRLKNILYFSYC